MEQVEKDLMIAKTVLGLDTSSENFDIDVYGRIYPWSNENIKSYYNYVDLNGKNTLAITASGDHVIYASLAGSKLVDAVDINKLAKYYSALKIAMIRTYDRIQLVKQMKNKGVFQFKKAFINRIDIEEIESFLTDEEAYFWSGLTKNKTLIDDNIFRWDGFRGNVDLPYYIEDENTYKKLQENLEKCKITYYDMDLSEKNLELPNTYDCVYLSNVLEHVWLDSKQVDTLNNCENALNQNGKIIACRKNGASDLFLAICDNRVDVGRATILTPKK